jgi:uncharacterized repeat protein (TIGR01451 family)
MVSAHMAGIGGGRRVSAQLPPLVSVAVDDVLDPVLLPAFEVEYVIEVINFSQQPITNVTISGETPGGTFFGEASTSVGTIEAPPQGEPGQIVVSVGTLNPGMSVRMRFELGLEAPAGSQLVFRATVTSDEAPTREVVEPTFVVNRGEPILRWEAPPLRPSTENPGPRVLRVDRPAEPLIPPQSFPVEPVDSRIEYRLYRADGPGVALAEENLVATFLPTQRNTGALAEPGFYVVTAVRDGVESEPTNPVSFGRGEPVVDSIRVVDGVLKARGSNFDGGVEVTIDGLTFNRPAAVKRGGTRVNQSGRLSNGQTLKRYLRESPAAAVCFRNENGSIACGLYAGSFVTP